MKKFVKKGFLDEFEVMKMFSTQDAKKEIKDQDKGTWITLLIEALEKKIEKPPVTLESLIEQIQGAIKDTTFDQEQNDTILRNLKCLIFYQQQLKQ